MPTPTLVVYGDASVDISVRVADLPAAGLDTAAWHPMVTPGGSAANCAATVARLGHRVHLVANVGNDLFSRIIIDDLLAHGVDISALEVTEGPSALVIGMIDPGGQRTFVSARGPAAQSRSAESYLPLLDHASLVHVSGYAFQSEGSRSVALNLLEEARRRQIATSLDPSPQFPAHFDPESDWLEGIDYLFPSTQEAIAITGAGSPADAGQALRELGVKTVVITMGDDGCLLVDQHGAAHFPAYGQFPVVDTTGAGDGFAGGFLSVILAGGSPPQACRVGNLVAAHIISKRGGHTGSPLLEDLLSLMKRYDNPRLLKAVRTIKAPYPSR